ncbi:hypothetical protein As57867_009686, partial [Aphanomyces stellatus]
MRLVLLVIALVASLSMAGNYRPWAMLYSNASFSGDVTTLEPHTTLSNLRPNTSFGSFKRLPPWNLTFVLVLYSNHDRLYLLDTNEYLPPLAVDSLGVVSATGTDAAITLFGNTNFHGPMRQYLKPAQVLEANASIASIWILEQDLVVAIYSEPNFGGNRTFVVGDCTDLARFKWVVKSFQVMTRHEMYRLVRNEFDLTSVIMWFEAGYPSRYADPVATFDILEVGQENSALHLGLRFCKLDIPRGLAVVSYLRINFKRPSLVYKSSQSVYSMWSFRVMTANQATPFERNVASAVRLYTLESNDELDVLVGERLDSIDFLTSSFGSRFAFMVVPPGFQVVGYADYNLRGYRIMFHPGVHASIEVLPPKFTNLSFHLGQLNSFQVVNSTDDLAEPGNPNDQLLPVQCFPYPGNT